MKNLKIVLVVLFLLMLTQASQAVDLEEGWYVRFDYVSVEGMRIVDGSAQYWTAFWSPASVPGQYGSLLVEQSGSISAGRRIISVTQDYSSDPGVIFEDVGVLELSEPYYNWINFGWLTNYDASSLQLQVYKLHAGSPDELIWSQTKSGAQGGVENI